MFWQMQWTFVTIFLQLTKQYHFWLYSHLLVYVICRSSEHFEDIPSTLVSILKVHSWPWKQPLAQQAQHKVHLQAALIVSTVMKGWLRRIVGYFPFISPWNMIHILPESVLHGCTSNLNIFLFLTTEKEGSFQHLCYNV